MSKPFGASDSRPTALMLTPEAPYPLNGGGAMRTASLLEYLARRYQLDVIAFREPGAADPASSIPSDLVRRTSVIDLPFHSRSALARASRNVRRYLAGAAPLVDRFAGFEAEIAKALDPAGYDLGIIEHFWCAPYCGVLLRHCRRLVLDLHNIESVLLDRCGRAERFPRSELFRKFAATTRGLERRLLPLFSNLLVTSDTDAEKLNTFGANLRSIVYPNAVPLIPLPDAPKQDAIVFSGNLEYEPNRTAVAYFHRAIWPALRDRWPSLRWKIVGRNHARVKMQLRHDSRIDVTGPVDDAIRELACAKVAIAPLLAGSGTRIKIIEAWAAGLAVVSTTLGAEGLPAESGVHLLIADEPAAFIEAVSNLLNSEELRARLGFNGRALFENSFSWPAAWERLQISGL